MIRSALIFNINDQFILYAFKFIWGLFLPHFNIVFVFEGSGSFCLWLYMHPLHVWYKECWWKQTFAHITQTVWITNFISFVSRTNPFFPIFYKSENATATCELITIMGLGGYSLSDWWLHPAQSLCHHQLWASYVPTVTVWKGQARRIYVIICYSSGGPIWLAKLHRLSVSGQ